MAKLQAKDQFNYPSEVFIILRTELWHLIWKDHIAHSPFHVNFSVLHVVAGIDGARPLEFCLALSSGLYGAY